MPSFETCWVVFSEGQYMGLDRSSKLLQKQCLGSNELIWLHLTGTHSLAGQSENHTGRLGGIFSFVYFLKLLENVNSFSS